MNPQPSTTPTHRSPCTGVVLAGGLNSRFGGREKALIPLAGKAMIDHIIKAFDDLFDEIIIVSNQPQNHADRDATIVADLVDARSSLTGVHTALFYSRCDDVFICACDTPLVKTALIAALLNARQPGIDVVVPQTSDGLEPLCAVYARRCLEPIENRLKRGDYRIRRFFDRVRVKQVSDKRLRRVDPELLSFKNVNTPEDLAEAAQWI
ncbi:MAG: molybdenum cofactor guanylyltransferase [Desulfobacterales bacterium]|nr:molybdenum cofactor guanylyltransferase [Desulfobacterales bacterium]